MATLTSQKAASGVQPRALHAGVQSVTAVYTVTANLSAGDVIQMVKVPAGAVILDLKLTSGGGGGAYTGSVGDGNSVGRYISATTLASAGNNYAIYQNVPQITATTADGNYQYSADDTIDITVATVLTATATGIFTLRVFYAMDT